MKAQKIPEGRNPLLELCPFCGEPGEIFFKKNEGECRVRCSNPECPVRPTTTKTFPTEELAIKTWNTRKGAPGDAKTVAQALLEETQDLFLEK